MKKNVYADVEKKVNEIEKKWGSFEKFVVNSTIPTAKHRMRMEEYSSTFEEMKPVYLDLIAIEQADLLDYQNMAGSIDGEFN